MNDNAAVRERSLWLDVAILDPGPDAIVSYANHYLANGAVIVPVGGDGADDQALATLRALHPDRDVVGVPLQR